MTVYEQLLKDDWIQYFKDELDKGELRFTSDGKILAFTRISHQITWLYTDSTYDRDTHNVCWRYDKYFAGKLGFIHSRCHSCWKVVVKPKTVVDLFKLADLQAGLGYPAKCGAELRPFVIKKHPQLNLYGGYFYNDSEEDGQKCYRDVKRAIKTIDPDMSVLLKRGCSEFEMKYGPSDKWKILPMQHEWEKKFDEIFVVDDGGKRDYQPDYLIANIKRNWIHYAAENGDLTYKELTGGRSLNKECEYVTYHDQEPLIKVVGG